MTRPTIPAAYCKGQAIETPLGAGLVKRVFPAVINHCAAYSVIVPCRGRQRDRTRVRVFYSHELAPMEAAS